LTNLTSVILSRTVAAFVFMSLPILRFTDWSILAEPFVDPERRMPNLLAVSLSGFFQRGSLPYLFTFFPITTCRRNRLGR
jgi:hypothetical protein